MPADSSNPDESAFAGRWVARLRGRIIAQGGTPAQALRAAKQARPKEKPEIVFIPPMENLLTSPLLTQVRAALPDTPLHLVGGAVRDALLRRTTHDLDFAVPQGGIAAARKVANTIGAAFYALDEANDTGRVIVLHEDGMRDVMDFAAYRGPDLEADLRGRDFTINAIALDLATQSLIDPLNGALDLREKRIRACAPTAFTDDPVRILRAVRQAAAFGFVIHPETRQRMKADVDLLDTISIERRRDELFKIFEGSQPATALRALEMLGVLPYVLPEVPTLKGVAQSAPHVHEVWTHTLRLLDYLEGMLAVLTPGYSADSTNDLLTGLLTLRVGRYRDQFAAHFAQSLNADRSVRGLLFFAALYHDIAKPLTKSVEESGRIRFLDHEQQGAEIAQARARTMALSADEVEHAFTLVRNHMRLHFYTNKLIEEKKEPTRRAIYRFFRDCGPAGVELCLLALADLRATYDHTLTQDRWAAALDVSRIFLENWFEKREETIAPPVLLNGHDVMQQLGLAPGKQVGQTLEAVREAQAMGQVNTRDEALAFARDWLAKHKEDQS